MTVPLHRLFSLDLLKGFVAVGRRMSITLAADDLCLTQSAVSRQVHALEAHLGVRLFVRKHRGVSFTNEGERLFRSADGAVRQLQQIAAEIRTSDGPRAVTVSASIGVTGLWLLPRLGRLQQLHPQLDVRLSASNQFNDLQADGVDLAVRYCKDSAAPAGAVRLFGETIAPVAHPSLEADLGESTDALERLPLLEFDDSRPWLRWRTWLDETGWKRAKKRGILRFNQYDQLIQAALAGQGMALGRMELIQPLVDGGQLTPVRSPPAPVPSPNAYWLLQAEADPRDDVRRVAAWIRREAGELRPGGAQASSPASRA
jgi:DNA-binding transcriptional LysR family regulator